MVGLYRDPDGSTIFNKSSKVTTSNTDNLQMHTIEGLKKRITELEVIAYGSQKNESLDSKIIIPEAMTISVAEITLNEGLGLPNNESVKNTIWDNEISKV